jgi:putative FmdB family regulatory protein
VLLCFPDGFNAFFIQVSAMPIYAYKCESCGHAKDVLQKISDAPLSVCPSCGEPAFRKQLTAAGFQLKGSGWYVTDFREGSKPAAAPAAEGSGTPTGDKSTSAPTSAPAAAPAPAPAASSSGGTTPATS